MGTETRTFVIYSYSLLQKDLYVFPEATGIIVPHSFGISKRFQQRSCLKYLSRISVNTFREVVNMLKIWNINQIDTTSLMNIVTHHSKTLQPATLMAIC